jgi:hypothetical protein
VNDFTVLVTEFEYSRLNFTRCISSRQRPGTSRVLEPSVVVPVKTRTSRSVVNNIDKPSETVVFGHRRLFEGDIDEEDRKNDRKTQALLLFHRKT